MVMDSLILCQKHFILNFHARCSQGKGATKSPFSLSDQTLQHPLQDVVFARLAEDVSAPHVLSLSCTRITIVAVMLVTQLFDDREKLMLVDLGDDSGVDENRMSCSCELLRPASKLTRASLYPSDLQCAGGAYLVSCAAEARAKSYLICCLTVHAEGAVCHGVTKCQHGVVSFGETLV